MKGMKTIRLNDGVTSISHGVFMWTAELVKRADKKPHLQPYLIMSCSPFTALPVKESG